MDGNNILGFAEGAVEEWNNRFKVVNIVISNKRDSDMGIGSMLM